MLAKCAAAAVLLLSANPSLAQSAGENEPCSSLWKAADADGNGVMSRDEDRDGIIEKANSENASLVKSESMTREEFFAYCSRDRGAGKAQNPASSAANAAAPTPPPKDPAKAY